MAIFKCKMCGGTLEINNETVATCEYCGTQQTLPKLSNDRRANLYDRANHFRRNSEFDKAMGIYEQILNDDKTDAEAYWSIVLCRYGIEYVEDPATRKRVPTVNRTQFTSIFDDDNYRFALQYSDSAQRSVYQKEARTINEIQKGILEISQKEEPFDVFICYKETDRNGRRTPDSVLANDLYHQLTQEGFKVFFSRITLEDKLGVAYEPYIFAALNSAKVMVVLGTKPEYFNAVWVKNEWSRFLALIKSGAKKILIPAYKDMDPYDLPEEFSHLQAQDMSKLGFMQDLIRGIKKIAQTETLKQTVVKETVVAAGNANTAPLLKRAYMFLEDEDWDSANAYCEKVLDIDPENAYAYLGKLMAELHVRNHKALPDCNDPFDNMGNYQKAIRFADDKLRMLLEAYIKKINDRLEANRCAAIYKTACNMMSVASQYNSIENYQTAIEKFESILEWDDAQDKILVCKKKIKELRIAEQKNAKKRKKIISIVAPIICVIIVFLVILYTVIIPSNRYKSAETLLASGDRLGAAKAFSALGSYQDAHTRSFYLWGEIAGWETISAGGWHTVGLKSDGHAVVAGYDDDGVGYVSKWADLVAISAGGNHIVGLHSDGTVVAVGYNEYGQCEVAEWTDIVAISAGTKHTVGLKSDGTVVATEYTSDNEYAFYGGQCNVSDWTDIVSISASDYHTLGLKSDGTVVVAGENLNGQCDVSDWTDIIAISAGSSHVVGLKSDGTVVAVGEPFGGRCDVSDWTDIIAISAGYEHTVGLKSDGTVVATVYTDDLKYYEGQCDVHNWRDIVAISADDEHTVGLKSDGTVVAVGSNGDGRCDVSGWKDIKIP